MIIPPINAIPTFTINMEVTFRTCKFRGKFNAVLGSINFVSKSSEKEWVMIAPKIIANKDLNNRSKYCFLKHTYSLLSNLLPT